jgi:hypothetical protein
LPEEFPVELTICVGTVKGPGETPNDYLFIAPDPERRVKHGEFVYYLTRSMARNADPGPRHRRRPVKLFPDSFLADPTVPPASVAALLGYESEATELFEITVTVLGYHSQQLGDFINPRVPPVNGAPVYIAADELLGAVLSKRRKRGERGSAHIGSLLSRPDGAVPIALDVRGFTRHAPGRHRQHGQRQELPGRRAARRDAGAAQPRRRAGGRSARRVQHACRR